jgi:hypothetical protein
LVECDMNFHVAWGLPQGSCISVAALRSQNNETC